MGRKKTEHVVFDNMRKIRKRVDIKEYNSKTHDQATIQSKEKYNRLRMTIRLTKFFDLEYTLLNETEVIPNGRNKCNEPDLRLRRQL